MKARSVLAPYCELMRHIKLRTDALALLIKKQTGLPEFCVIEAQQLQIRMISETLAIACLLVHGDIAGAQSSKLTKAYQADLIMNALEKLHPKFFPRPVRQIIQDGVPFGLENVEDGFLTKSELLKTYHSAGDFLHAGSIKDFLNRKQKHLDGIRALDWLNKLVKLLSCHSIFLADGPGSWEGKEPLKFASGEVAPRFHIVVGMNQDNTGLPGATIFESMGPAAEMSARPRPA